MASFTLTIASAEETLFSGEAKQVTLPGTSGEFTVLANHQPFVSTLRPGVVKVLSENGEKQEFEVKHGIFETAGKTATVLL